MPVIDIAPPAFMEDEEISIFADAVGKFYRQHADEKRVASWRDAGQVDREFWHEAGEAGLLGVSVPEEYGGHGGDFRHDLVVIDQQAKNGVEGFAASLHNVIILPYLVRHGTEEQKQKYLPRLVSGDLVSAIAMTEPATGSDLQSITTTALKDGNGYRLNGSKTYISNGQIADFIIVVAKTDPEQRAKGISLLLMETEGAEGFQRGKKLDKIGLDAQDTSELFFDDVFLPGDAVLGGEEGKGFYSIDGRIAARTAHHSGTGDGRDRARARYHGRIREGSQGLRSDRVGFSEHPIRACRSEGERHGGAGVRERLHSEAARWQGWTSRPPA